MIIYQLIFSQHLSCSTLRHCPCFEPKKYCFDRDLQRKIESDPHMSISPSTKKKVKKIILCYIFTACSLLSGAQVQNGREKKKQKTKKLQSKNVVKTRAVFVFFLKTFAFLCFLMPIFLGSFFFSFFIVSAPRLKARTPCSTFCSSAARLSTTFEVLGERGEKKTNQTSKPQLVTSVSRSACFVFGKLSEEVTRYKEI